MSREIKEMRLVRAGQVWSTLLGELIVILSNYHMDWPNIGRIRWLNLETGSETDTWYKNNETTQTFGWKRVT